MVKKARLRVDLWVGRGVGDTREVSRWVETL